MTLTCAGVVDVVGQHALRLVGGVLLSPVTFHKGQLQALRCQNSDKSKDIGAGTMYDRLLPCFCSLSFRMSSSFHSRAAKASSRVRLSGEGGGAMMHHKQARPTMENGLAMQ